MDKMRLIQRNRLKADTRLFEVRGGRLLARYRSLAGETGASIPLELLDSVPVHQRTIAWPWLGGSLLMALATASTAVFFPLPGMSATTTLYLAIAAGVGSLILLGNGMYRSHSEVLVLTRYSRLPLFRFLHRRPDAETFRTFVELLRRRIRRQRLRLERGEHDQQAAHLRELGRMVREGKLSQERFHQLELAIRHQREDGATPRKKDIEQEFRAGELRALRSLYQRGTLDEPTYEQAKQRILASF